MTAGPDSASPWRWLAAVIVVVTGLACGDDPTGTIPTCEEGTVVRPGDTVEGALTADDDRFARAFIDYYSLRLDASTPVAVTMTSRDLDPLLLAFDSLGAVTSEAFDSIGEPAGAEETALMDSTFGPGCHLIGASSWYPDSTGAYTVVLDTLPPP